MNRNGLLFFREMTPSQVWGSQPQYVVADHSSVVPGASFYDPSLDVIGEGSSGGDGSGGSGVSTVNAPARLAAEKAAADGGGSDKPSNGKSGSSGVSEDTMIVKEGPFQVEGVPGLTINRRTRSGNVTVDWIDGALWIAGIDGQWFSNPYHWFSKIGALFDAMRCVRLRNDCRVLLAVPSALLATAAVRLPLARVTSHRSIACVLYRLRVMLLASIHSPN